MRLYFALAAMMLVPAFAQDARPESAPPGAKLIASGFSFPEGPLVDKNGVLYFSDPRGNTIAKYEGGEARIILRDTKGANGLAMDKQGNIYACQGGGAAIIKITPAGDVSTFADNAGGKSFNNPNDLVFDKNGNLFFTNPGGKQETPRGVIRVRPDGTAEVAAEGLAYPNGIGISPDGKTLYVADFLGGSTLWKFPLADDGTLGKGEKFIEFGSGGPDGMAVAASGNVYAVLNMAAKIAVVSPEGKVLREILFPERSGVTNVCFGGPNFDTLYITVGLRGEVYEMPAGEPGLKPYSHQP